jgi:hypothetical protein
MKPYVFISSTIADLHHLRDSVRETLESLCYNPLMSEYGEIDFRQDSSAIDSCYKMIEQCQLFILIISKRYGFVCDNKLSVTHNEFQYARKLQIPIICLLEEEVDSYRRIYSQNKDNATIYPDMDNPEGTFGLISEFTSYKTNNGFIKYKTNQEANIGLKGQLAGLFFRLLNEKNVEVDNTIKDILSEIQSLKHSLVKDNLAETKKFTRGIRLLMEAQFTDLKTIAEMCQDGMENAVPFLINSLTFIDVTKKIGVTVKIVTETDSEVFNVFGQMFNTTEELNMLHSVAKFEPYNIFEPYGITADFIPNKRQVVKFGYNEKEKLLFLNDAGKNYFEYMFKIYKTLVNQEVSLISSEDLHRIQFSKHTL